MSGGICPCGNVRGYMFGGYVLEPVGVISSFLLITGGVTCTLFLTLSCKPF